jgi:monoamine oxidase
VNASKLDVVVIGAGLAGLRTAELLGERGLRVVVLEARPRVGGRTKSETIAGARFDAGGQWLGPTQPRVHALVRRLGLRTHPTFNTGKKALHLGHEGADDKLRWHKGDIPAMNLLHLAELQLAIRRIDKIGATVPTEAPWLAPEATVLDGETAAAWAARQLRSRNARAMVDTLVRSVFSVEPHELSALYLVHYARCAGGIEALARVEGGGQQDRILGGAQQLAEGLAAALRARDEQALRLGHAVRHIEHHGDGVVCHGSGPDGAVFALAARRLVFAASPTLQQRIGFDPVLPVARRQLIARMPMGATIKCLAVYDRPFWRDQGLAGELVSTGDLAAFVYDNSALASPAGIACEAGEARAALVAFVTGDAARRWSGEPPAVRRRAVLDHLARAFGAAAQRPIAYHEKDWGLDDWAGGCPVGVAGPGVFSRLGPALAAPVGAIHHAGTETGRVWAGFMEGALESAERVSAEVAAALSADSRGSPA